MVKVQPPFRHDGWRQADRRWEPLSYGAMPKLVVFLSGPIGVGKTSLGRGLAARLKGVFLDGDDFSRPDLSWYACILRTSRGLSQAGLAAVEQTGLVVIAYPLRCTDWIYYKRRFGDCGVRTVFVGLRASHASIIDEGRGRTFSEEERHRIARMMAERYDARPFFDLIVDTDQAPFDDVLDKLEGHVRILAG